MRILFVHEVNWLAKIVYEIHDFPELLSLRGHDVVFLDFAEGRNPDGLRRIVDLRTEVVKGASKAHAGSLVEVRTPGRVFAPPLDRLAASLTHVPALWKALSREHFDAIVLYGVPTNGWQTIHVARHFNVPVLFRAIDISHLLRKTAFGPAIHRAETFIYRNATAISCHNEALRQYCISEGANSQRVSIEYPGLDLDRFSPGARDPQLCAKYGISPNDKVVMFMGTLYRFAGLDWFMRQMASVLTQRSDVRLLLIGGGEEEQALRSLAQEQGIQKSVIFTGWIDYPSLADHLRLADVAFNTFRRSMLTDCALPGKIFQYLGCGIPTVCTPLSGLCSTLSEGDGILYRELDESFASAISSLLGNDERRLELARTARAAMERLCRWDVAVEAFERAIVRTVEYQGFETRGRK